MFDGGWRFPDEHKMFAHLLGHTTYFSEMKRPRRLVDCRASPRMSRCGGVGRGERTCDPGRDPTVRPDDAAGGLRAPTHRSGGAQPARRRKWSFRNGGDRRHSSGRRSRGARRRDRLRGPVSADTVYVKAFGGAYDGVVAMYHDQGQIATKLKGFNRGVTVTADSTPCSRPLRTGPRSTSRDRAWPIPARFRPLSGWPSALPPQAAASETIKASFSRPEESDARRPRPC